MLVTKKGVRRWEITVGKKAFGGFKQILEKYGGANHSHLGE